MMSLVISGSRAVELAMRDELYFHSSKSGPLIMSR